VGLTRHKALRLAPSLRQARETSVARSGHHSTRNTHSRLLNGLP
jgi:hypothetical protein